MSTVLRKKLTMENLHCDDEFDDRSCCRQDDNNLNNGNQKAEIYKNDAVINVDVIIPVHNAASTIGEAVESAMAQEIPQHLHDKFSEMPKISIAVCCYDDGSTDKSWDILKKLQQRYSLGLKDTAVEGTSKLEIPSSISSTLWIETSHEGLARGAGFARNRAVELGTRKHMQEKSHIFKEDHHFLCLLDSDDTMHPNRVAEQVSFMMALNQDDKCRTLLGCTFDRDPPDSTWHYARWANGLSDDRLMLEQFREVTIIQPTWMVCQSRWHQLGGYVEAPLVMPDTPSPDNAAHQICEKTPSALVHPDHDTSMTLKLAEDLRFFHSHLQSNGVIRLHRSNIPLVTYRHSGTSQSFQTPRKLLLQLRVLAFERSILRQDVRWQRHDGSFVVWGAGRDGKDFVKTLHADLRKRVYCFVDVDQKKIDSGYYVNREIDVRIPIVHFSLLANDSDVRERLHQRFLQGNNSDELVGRIDKGKPGTNLQSRLVQTSEQTTKKRKINALKSSDSYLSLLPSLPVVVCVAMYRTNGVLEKNVADIGRKEGVDLWHFS